MDKYCTSQVKVLIFLLSESLRLEDKELASLGQKLFDKEIYDEAIACCSAAIVSKIISIRVRTRYLL
jgi:hypothetical protein